MEYQLQRENPIAVFDSGVGGISGSNMNLGQMRFRCPDAEVVGNVRLEDYRLAFRGRAPGNGVATVLPEKGSYVDGVLWKITEACEKNLMQQQRSLLTSIILHTKSVTRRVISSTSSSRNTARRN